MLDGVRECRGPPRILRRVQVGPAAGPLQGLDVAGGQEHVQGHVSRKQVRVEGRQADPGIQDQVGRPAARRDAADPVRHLDTKESTPQILGRYAGRERAAPHQPVQQSVPINEQERESRVGRE